MKTAFGGLIGTVTAAFFLWTASTLVEVDKRTAITEVKVRENNKMIKPLWEDFIRRSAKNGNGEIANGKAGFEIWK